MMCWIPVPFSLIDHLRRLCYKIQVHLEVREVACIKCGNISLELKIAGLQECL